MKRVLTALILVPIVSWIILRGSPEIFLVTVALLASMCWFEFSQMIAPLCLQFPRWAGFIPGIALLYTRDRGELLIILTAIAALVVALRGSELAKVLPSAAIFLMGVLYIFGAWKTAILLRQYSVGWLMFSIIINWIGDSAALYAGKSFGKNKLAPGISPGKTWEGAIASLIFGSFGAVCVLHYLSPEANLFKASIAALLANSAGQIGDLVESAIKRGAGVKDSGTMLPGHGGWLDRVDSSLFSMPVVYALYPWLA